MEYEVTFGDNDPTKVEENTTTTAPTTNPTTPDDKELIGWATTENSTEVEVELGGETPAITGTTTYYPVYQAKSYDVSFGSNTPREVDHGSTTVAPTTNPTTPEGSTLIGWSKAENSTTVDVALGGTTPAITAPTTYYPVYEAKSYDVNFGGNPSEEIEHGSTVTAPETDPETPAGSTLVGWTTEKDGTTAEVLPGEETPAITGPTTYYPVYEKAIYDITFGSNDTVNVAHGGNTIAPTTNGTATPVGSTLIGWSTSPNDTEVEVDLGEEIGPILKSDIYYPVNVKNTYEVSFGTNPSETIEHGSTATAPTTEGETPDDKVLVGWATTENSATVEVELGAETPEITAPTTYYPVYKDVEKFTVTYLDETGAVYKTDSTTQKFTANSDYTPADLEGANKRTLSGWYDEATNTFYPAGEEAILEGNVTLTPVIINHGSENVGNYLSKTYDGEGFSNVANRIKKDLEANNEVSGIDYKNISIVVYQGDKVINTTLETIPVILASDTANHDYRYEGYIDGEKIFDGDLGLKVNHREITVSVEGAVADESGTEQLVKIFTGGDHTLNYTVEAGDAEGKTGLATGHTAAELAPFTASTAGTHKYSPSITDVKITNTAGEDVTANYTVTIVPADLVIEGATTGFEIALDTTKETTKTYDGEELTLEDTDFIVTDEAGNELSGLDFTYTDKDGKPIDDPSILDAGTVEVVVTAASKNPDGTVNFEASTTVTLTVNKKDITVSVAGATADSTGSVKVVKPYTGSDQSLEYTVESGLATGEKATMPTTTPAVSVGVYPYSPAVEDITITDASGKDTTANYNITVVPAELEITEATTGFEIQLNGGKETSKTYDGTDLTLNSNDFTVTDAAGKTVTGLEFIYTDKDGKIVDPSIVDAGTKEITVTAVSKNADGTVNFAVSTAVTLTVEKRPVTMTVTEATANGIGRLQVTKSYTGEEFTLEHTAQSATAETGLVPGHSTLIPTPAVATTVGRYTYEPTVADITISSTSGDVTANYTITVLPADLLITKATEGFEINTDTETSKTYDGTELTLTDNDFTISGKDGIIDSGIEITYTDADGNPIDPTVLDAGTIDVYVTATSKNADDTINFEVTTVVTLTVSPRPVSLVIGNVSLQEGNGLTTELKESLVNTALAFATTDANDGKNAIIDPSHLLGATLTTPADITVVGTYLDSLGLQFTLADGTVVVLTHNEANNLVNGNYDITLDFGTLTVTAKPVVTPGGGSGGDNDNDDRNPGFGGGNDDDEDEDTIVIPETEIPTSPGTIITPDDTDDFTPAPVPTTPTAPTTPETSLPSAGTDTDGTTGNEGTGTEGNTDGSTEEETAPEIVIEDAEIPMTDSPEIQIEEPQIPTTAGPQLGGWALVDLVLALITALTSVILLASYSRRYRDEDTEEEKKSKGRLRLMSILLAAIAVGLFLFTQNLALPMVMVDKWTLVFAVITLVQLIVAFMARHETEQPKPIH